MKHERGIADLSGPAGPSDQEQLTHSLVGIARDLLSAGVAPLEVVSAALNGARYAAIAGGVSEADWHEILDTERDSYAEMAASTWAMNSRGGSA